MNSFEIPCVSGTDFLYQIAHIYPLHCNGFRLLERIHNSIWFWVLCDVEWKDEVKRQDGELASNVVSKAMRLTRGEMAAGIEMVRCGWFWLDPYFAWALFYL